MSNAMTIGENLRAKRKALKLSQGDIAELIQTPTKTYIGWEHGRNAPPADKMGALAKVLGCSTDELIFEHDERNVSEGMRALFHRFDALPQEMKTQARTMLRAMVLSLEEEAESQKNRAA